MNNKINISEINVMDWIVFLYYIKKFIHVRIVSSNQHRNSIMIRIAHMFMNHKNVK